MTKYHAPILMPDGNILVITEGYVDYRKTEQLKAYDDYYNDAERANKIPLSFDNWCAKK